MVAISRDALPMELPNPQRFARGSRRERLTTSQRVVLSLAAEHGFAAQPFGGEVLIIDDNGAVCAIRSAEEFAAAMLD